MRFMTTFGLIVLSIAAIAQPITLTEDDKADIARTIRGHGFNCPSLVSAGGRGSDHYGKVFRVRCGPLSGRGSMDEFPQFRLTIRPAGGALVRPWTE